MTCSDFLQGFSDYVDGVGSPDFRSRADGHLEDCPDCRHYLEVYERGASLLRSFPELEISDDFEPRLKHRIYHIEDGSALSPDASGSATTAATVLGMAVLLVLAAWSPTMLTRDTVVDLSPIVVTRSAPSSMGIRAVRTGELPDRSDRLERGRQLWSGANELLFQYSPLAERSNRSRIQRAGLD